jgi:hypothetical protein
MAFEFLGKALRGATDILGGLADEVGNGRANREDDLLKVRRAFGALGRMEEPEDEPSGFIDRAFDTAIHGFQRDKGLRVDGLMRPGGPTERSLQDDVLGHLKQGSGEFGKSLRSRFDRFGSLYPAASLLDDRDAVNLDRDASDRGGSLGYSILESAPPQAGP